VTRVSGGGDRCERCCPGISTLVKEFARFLEYAGRDVVAVDQACRSAVAKRQQFRVTHAVIRIDKYQTAFFELVDAACVIDACPGDEFFADVVTQIGSPELSRRIGHHLSPGNGNAV